MLSLSRYIDLLNNKVWRWSLARSDALGLAINGAATATAAGAVALAGAGEGGEAACGARDLLLEAWAFIFANHGGPDYTAFRVASIWASVARSIASTHDAASEARYVKPASGPEEPTRVSSVVIVAGALGGSGSGRPRGRGYDEEEKCKGGSGFHDVGISKREIKGEEKVEGNI